MSKPQISRGASSIILAYQSVAFGISFRINYFPRQEMELMNMQRLLKIQDINAKRKSHHAE